MTSIINPQTFEVAAEQPEHGYWIAGTVEVTLGKETRRVEATKANDQITAFGMTGRYETGKRAWPARATRVIDPTTGRAWDRVQFGRDDRAGGRFNKTNALSFA